MLKVAFDKWQCYSNRVGVKVVARIAVKTLKIKGSS